MASIGVSCPCAEFTTDFMDEALPPLLECARALSLAFGLRDLDLEQSSLA